MSKKVIIIEHIKNATIGTITDKPTVSLEGIVLSYNPYPDRSLTVNQFFYFKEFINYTEIGKLLYL